MAGGMSRRRGPTLAERRTVVPSAPPGRDPHPDAVPGPVGRGRPRPVVTRHCWVVGLPESPGRWAGLLAEWRQDGPGSGWEGRVVYAVDDGAATVMVEAWVPAAHLEPAR